VSEPIHEITEDGTVYVGLVLAHPLAKLYAERCQAKEAKDYSVGDTIYVSREWGNALIDAGQVQVDPEDGAARQAALFLNKRNQPIATKDLRAAAEKAETEETPEVAPDSATPAKTDAQPTKAATKAK
jgi:hypothetical protein